MQFAIKPKKDRPTYLIRGVLSIAKALSISPNRFYKLKRAGNGNLPPIFAHAGQVCTTKGLIDAWGLVLSEAYRKQDEVDISKGNT